MFTYSPDMVPADYFLTLSTVKEVYTCNIQDLSESYQEAFEHLEATDKGSPTPKVDRVLSYCTNTSNKSLYPKRFQILLIQSYY